MADLQYIKGLSELQAYFRQFPVAVGKKVLRKGAGAGAQVVKAAIHPPIGKSRKGHTAGTLSRSKIVVFDRRDSNDNQAVYLVTFRKGTAAQGGLNRKGTTFKLSQDAFYAAWVERGHRIVGRFKGKRTDFPLKGRRRLTGLTLRRRASTDSVPPHPFFEPAVVGARQSAQDAMVETMTKGVNDLIAS